MKSIQPFVYSLMSPSTYNLFSTITIFLNSQHIHLFCYTKVWIFSSTYRNNLWIHLKSELTITFLLHFTVWGLLDPHPPFTHADHYSLHNIYTICISTKITSLCMQSLWLNLGWKACYCFVIYLIFFHWQCIYKF